VSLHALTDRPDILVARHTAQRVYGKVRQHLIELADQPLIEPNTTAPVAPFPLLSTPNPRCSAQAYLRPCLMQPCNQAQFHGSIIIVQGVHRALVLRDARSGQRLHGAHHGFELGCTSILRRRLSEVSLMPDSG